MASVYTKEGAPAQSPTTNYTAIQSATPTRLPSTNDINIPGIIAALLPTLAASDVSQTTGSYVVGDNVLFTATTSDADGRITTGVGLYLSGVLVSAMTQAPAGTWTYTVAAITAGAKSYTAVRAFSGGTTESTAVTFTVLAELAPDGITSATLLAWFRTPESIQLGGTPLAGGTSPPTVTLTGTLTNQDIDFYMTMPVGGARGTATYSVSVTGVGGAVFQTGTTAATVALGATGITINFPVGTYNSNNTYHAVSSQWNDKTVNAHNYVNTTAGTRPFVLRNDLGNQTALLFDGVNDLQNCITALATDCAGGTNNSFTVVTMFSLLTVPGGVNIACVYCLGNTGTLARVTADITSTAWRLRRFDNSANDSVISSIVPALVGPVLHIWRFDGTSSTLEINGTDVIGGDVAFDVPGANSTAAAITLNNVSLSAQKTTSTGNWLEGKFFEQAFYNGAISDVELAQLRKYFAAVA